MLTPPVVTSASEQNVKLVGAEDGCSPEGEHETGQLEVAFPQHLPDATDKCTVPAEPRQRRDGVLLKLGSRYEVLVVDFTALHHLKTFGLSVSGAPQPPVARLGDDFPALARECCCLAINIHCGGVRVARVKESVSSTDLVGEDECVGLGVRGTAAMDGVLRTLQQLHRDELPISFSKGQANICRQ